MSVPVRGHLALFGGLVAALLALLLAAVATGQRAGGVGDVVAALFGASGDPSLDLAVQGVRLPRAAQAALLGAILALGGLLSQAVAHNRLATPSILGVHNGANVALITTLVLAPAAGELPLVAASFAGALLAAAAVVAIGRIGAARSDPATWLLAGVLLDRFAAGVAAAILLAHGMHNALLGWTVGRLVHVDWWQVALLAPTFAVGLLVGLPLVARLDALQLGDTVARGLGIRVVRVRVVTVLLVVCLSGAAIAVAGPVAYLGLVVPNLLTRRVLPSPRSRFVACALAGAAGALLADLAARLGSGRTELPLGLWTMLFGATFFLAVSLLTPVRRLA